MAHEEGTDYGIGKEPDHMEKLSKIDETKVDQVIKSNDENSNAAGKDYATDQEPNVKTFLDNIEEKLSKLNETQLDQVTKRLKKTFMDNTEERLSKLDEKQLDKLSKALQKPFLDKIKKKLGKIDEEKFDQFIETLKSRVEEAKSANGDYVAVVDQDFLDNVEKDVKMHSRKEKESKAGKNAVGSDYGIPVIGKSADGTDYGIPVIVTRDYLNIGN